MRPQHAAHRNGQQRRGQREADPEPARHVAEFGIVFFELTVRGSSAMPQIGQLPGSDLTTSGCIGQVYSVVVACWRRRFRIQCHAALGAGARPDLADFGAHRTDVGGRVFCIFLRRCRGGNLSGWSAADLRGGPSEIRPGDIFAVGIGFGRDERIASGLGLEFSEAAGGAEKKFFAVDAELCGGRFPDSHPCRKQGLSLAHSG